MRWSIPEKGVGVDRAIGIGTGSVGGRRCCVRFRRSNGFVGEREVLLCRWTDSPSPFQFIPASGGSRTTHASLFSVTEAESTSTSPDVTVASASIANTARTLVFAEMVIVCTRARTKGAAAPGFCTVRPCRQSIEVSSREHIHAIPT